MSEWLFRRNAFGKGAPVLLCMFYAYVLKSKSAGTHYYGSTEDLEKRLKEHNSGKVKYTKGRRPWQLHYHEEFETRSEALKREKFFKTISGYLYLKRKESFEILERCPSG